MALESGTRLGHYEVTDLLGKGGMGEVYRARDTKLGREVAIKVLPSEFSQDAERLARLEREARMLAALNHPNIAAIHGLEESGDTRFLVLELVEGDTLADRLRRGAIPVEESLKRALQIAEALEAAHEKGVIHRDLKPANIKITPEGRVKVLDFGLAKAFEGDIGDVNLSNSPTLSLQATRQGVILGTAAYMSPEQARGQTVDQRADVWAFGCVLYQMLSGRSPFEGDDVSLTLARVLERTPDYGLLPPNLHSRIRFLLERCLEKEPRNRCQSVGEARVEIQKVLDDPAGVLVSHHTVAEPARKMALLPWVAAIVLALIAGIAGWTLKPEDPRFIRRFSQAWPADQTPRAAGRPVVAFAQNGGSFVYNTASGLYRRELGDLETQVIQGTGEPMANPFLSPDGEWVGYWHSVDQELQRISVSGGAPVVIAETSNPFGATWGVDDMIVFAQPEGIMRVSANGGVPELIVATEPPEQVHGPQLLPGGEWVLFTLATEQSATRWDDALVVAQSLDTEERRVLIEGGTDARYVPTGHIVYVFEGSLFAVPFDLGSVEVTGGPVPISDGLIQANQVNTGTANYGFSDDGTLLQLYLEDAEASVQETSIMFAEPNGNVDRIELRPGFYGHPRISPDGSRLALETQDASGRSEIWIYDLDGQSQIRQLTQGGNSSRPVWTSDGEYVTFTSTRDGTSSIWWQRADGSAQAEQLTHSDGPQHWPDAWSPDGSTLLFTSYSTEEQVLWTVTDGQEPVEFSGGQSGGGTFSPSGDWIAYRMPPDLEDGLNVQIFVKPFPGPGPERQVSLNGGSFPIFSADGTQLYYRRASPSVGGPPQNELVSIDISTDGTVTYGTERVVPIQGLPARFGVRDFDVVPGEDRLILMSMQGSDGAATGALAEFRIVLNWFQELQERVPVR